MKNIRIILSFLAAVIVFKTGGAQSRDSYVLMISFDGFRHDYVEKYNLRHFKKFIAKGSMARYMIPSYPTKTFPNHYTLVTGLYPGKHGLVDNSFFDRETNCTYRISDRDAVEDAHFYSGTPLWQLASEQGLKSASYFWVGSEAPIRGKFPDYYETYDSSVDNEARIDAVINWFQLPKFERPNIVTLYFSLVDSEGHNSGPNSGQLKKTVQEADRLLGLLMDKMEYLPVEVNTILVSDHGMAEIYDKLEYKIPLSHYFDIQQDGLVLQNNGTHAHLYIDNLQLREKIFDKLYDTLPHSRVYKKGQIPPYLNYDLRDRIGDILIIADPVYSFVERFAPGVGALSGKTRGNHGYDALQCPEMHTIFYANGPNIKQNQVVPPFHNIHIYPFVALILGLKIPEVDGDPKILKDLLKK